MMSKGEEKVESSEGEEGERGGNGDILRPWIPSKNLFGFELE